MGHARLMPSSAGRWIHCPGSVTMEERYPDRNEDDGEEGTASHWLAAERLQGRGGYNPLGSTAPNGVIMTEEIIESAKVFVDAVQMAAMGAQLVVEQPIAIPSVHPECWGTPDTWYFLPDRREIHIWDYKYGYGVVEAAENWQAMCYAAGIIDYLAGYYKQASGIFDQGITVVIHIVQPRPFHILGPIREWRVSGGALRGYINRLAAAAAEALSASPTVTSGKYCRYCRARHACPAAQKAAMYSIEYEGQAVPEELDPRALSIEYATLERAAKAIEYRKTGLEAQITAIIEAGGHVPGWIVQRGSGRAVWSKPAAEIFALGELFGAKLQKDPEPITPAQAKKAGIPEELVKAYTTVPQSGFKLVPAGNTMAARVFGQAK